MAAPGGRFDQFQHADIEELADEIAELLQNPITIEDADHRLIAHSKHGDSTDQARWSTILGRRVPEKVLTRLWKDGVFQQLWTQDDPVHVPAKDEIGLGNRVAIAIRKGSDVLGYIWAQEINRPFTPEDDDILRRAARMAVAKLVQRQGKRKQEEQRRKDFFWELLLGNHASESAIEQKAAGLQIVLPQPYIICIIESDTPHFEQFLYPFLQRDKMLWVTDGSQLITMLGVAEIESSVIFSQAEQFLTETVGKLQERFGIEAGCGVYGSYYKKCIDVGRSYREALQVLQTKKLFPLETSKVQGYHDLGMYRFLPEMKKWAEENRYQNEHLQRLKRYDQESQNNLVETLETFLDSVGKVNLTAQRLHIHNNTLSYRLRRIEEIMGVDLDDASLRTSLYLDLKLEKISKEISS